MKKPLILALLILLAVPSSPSSAGNLVKYKGQKAGQYCKNLEVGAKVNLPTGQKLICARSSASAKPKWSKVAILNNVTPKPSSSSPAPSESPKPISEPSPTPTGTTCDGSFTCQVGDVGPGGGVVYYINLSGFSETGAPCGSSCHYLEAAPANWHSGGDPAITWSTGSNQTAMTGALGTVIGTGYQNSLAIVAHAGNSAANSAAVAARAYTGGSKNDWFLPSKNELAQLYAQATSVGGFVDSDYWSSTETGFSSGAWFQDFLNGYQNFNNRNGTFYVRPVRAF